MASTVNFHSILLPSNSSRRTILFHSPRCYNKNQSFALSSSQLLLPSNSLLRLKKEDSLLGLPTIRVKKPKSAKTRALPVVFAAQSNFLRVLQTVWKVVKDGIDGGTALVPVAVPRPIARISVTVVAVTLALFVVKSFVSTAFFVLAVMGLAYFAFLAFNKDEGPRGGGGEKDPTSAEDTLEEARRIMEKYK